MKITSFFLKGGLLLLLVLLLAAAGIAVRVMYFGPLSLEVYQSNLDTRLAKAFPDAVIRYREPTLTWNAETDSFDLRASNVSIIDERRGLNIQLPQLAAALKARELLKGNLALKRIDLIGPEANLVWNAAEVNDRLASFLQGETFTSREEEEIPDVLRIMGVLFAMGDAGNAVLSPLEEVRVTQASVRFMEEETGAEWHLPNAVVDLRRMGRQRGLTIESYINAGSESPFVRLQVQLDNTGNNVSSAFANAQIMLEQVNLAALAEQVGLGGVWATVNMPVDGIIDVALNPSGSLGHIAADVRSGPGRFYDPELFETAVSFQGIELSARFDAGSRQLAITRFAATLDDDARLSADGIIDFSSDAGPAVNMFATATDLSIDNLTEYWPLRLGRTGRQWVMDNMPAAHISEGRFAINIDPDHWGQRPMPAEMFRIDFSFEQASANYLTGMPLIREGRGQGRVTPEELFVRLEEGLVDTLILKPSTFRIENLSMKGEQIAHADISTSATIPEIMRLINNPPLGLTDRIGLDPDDVTGLADVRTRLSFPLIRDLTGAHVDYHVEAAGQRVTYAGLSAGINLTDGNLDMEIRPGQLEADGDIQLNGVPFNLNWRDELGQGEGGYSSLFHLTGNMDVDALQAFGVPAEGYFSGTTDVTIDLAGQGFNLARGEIRADLLGANITADQLGWLKEAGEEGHASFEIGFDNQSFNLSNLEITGQDTRIEGTLSLSRATGGITYAQLSNISTPYHQGRLDLSLRPDGVYELRVDAARLNARPWLEQLLAPEGLGANMPLNLSITADSVLAMNGVVMNDLTFEARRTASTWQSMALHSVYDDGGVVDLSLTPGQQKKELRLTSDRAGLTALAAGMFQNGQGGVLNLTASLNAPGTIPEIEGALNVDDFRLVKTSALVEALAAESGREINDLLDDRGLSLRRLRLPFKVTDGILDIRDARANGPSIGFILDGQADMTLDEVSMKGVIIPAYTLNSFLGSIPIVGDILVGGRGGGLFALNFAIEGSFDDPTVTTNPLSALAPGILRRFMQGERSTIDQEGRQQRIEDQNDQTTNGGGGEDNPERP